MWQADAKGHEHGGRNAYPFSTGFFLVYCCQTLPYTAGNVCIWVFGGFCVLTPYPVALLMEIKVFLTAWKKFLCFNLERLDSVPKDCSGSWIKLCGKILYLLPCCHCSRCWVSFYCLVYLSFCDSNVPKSPTFLPICRLLMSSCNQTPRPFAPSVVSSHFRASTGVVLHQRVVCANPRSSVVFLTHIFAYSISGVCLFFLMIVLPIQTHGSA